MLPAWARRFRCRHQGHCAERKRRKATKAFPQGISQFMVASVARWENACDTRAKVQRSKPDCQTHERKARDAFGDEREDKRTITAGKAGVSVRL